MKAIIAALALVLVLILGRVAVAERLPDEGAFCIDRDKDGTCLRVCAAGPQECHRRQRRLRAENPKEYRWLIWGKR